MAIKLLAPFRHAWLVFSAETKRLVAYRAQFWFELVASSLIELFIALAVWRAVYESAGKSTIAGYTLSGMLLYVTVAIFFSQATKGTGVGTFQREIYEGGLTRYLIYPLSIYSYKLGTFLPRSLFAVGQLVLVLVAINLLELWPSTVTLSLASIVLGLLALFLACLMYFVLLACLESLAFWVDNVWALSYALQIGLVFLSGKAIPLELFPTWARIVLEYSPFPYFAYIPTQIFLGQISPAQLPAIFALELFWLIFFAVFSKVLINHGLYRYTGVGQ